MGWGSTSKVLGLAMTISAIALGGCSNTTEPAPYQPPALPPAASATLSGSQIGNVVVHVARIDGALLPRPERGVDDKLVLAPGHHTITFAVQTPAITQAGDVLLNAEADKAYVVRGEPPVVMGPGCVAVAGWIEDSSGKAVTDKVFAEVEKFTSTSEVPLVGGGFIVIPGRMKPLKCPAS